MSEKVYPFTIVGAGIIGVTIALTLQKAGVPVLLLEKDQVGRGASWGNAGHIATEQVYPVADPSVLKQLPKMLFDPLGPLRIDWRYLPTLMPWGLKLLGNMRAQPFNHIHEQLQRLNHAALPAWRALCEEWDLHQWVKIEGSLLVAEKEKTLAALKKHGDILNAIEVPNRMLSQSALLEMAPALSDSQIGGLFFPDTGHVVNLSAVITHLTKAFQQLGGEVREQCEVLEFTPQGDFTLITTNHQGTQGNSHHSQITTEKVLLSTGAFSKPFAKQLSKIEVPLETERGYHLMLPHETNRLTIPVSSADRKFIMTPMEEGLRLAGTVEYGGLQLPPNMKRAQNFIPLASSMLKEKLDQRDSAQWMGFRPTICDSLPVIDKVHNCYFAFGHQHLGLTHAAITAEIIKAMHFNEPLPIACEAFAINRFQ